MSLALHYPACGLVEKESANFIKIHWTCLIPDRLKLMKHHGRLAGLADIAKVLGVGVTKVRTEQHQRVLV